MDTKVEKDESVTMEDFIGIKYKLDRIEDGKEYCDFMCYSKSKRKKFSAQEEVLKKEISCCCPMYRYVIKSECQTTIYSFKLESNYRFCSWSNGFNKNKVKFEGNSIYSIQKGRKTIESWRHYTPTEMVMTITCEGHTAKKYYRAIGHDDSCWDEDRCCVRVSRQEGNNLVD